MSVTGTILNSTTSVSAGLSGVSELANATSSYAKKIKSLVKEKKSPAAIRDLLTNGYLAQNSVFKPQFFARAFDEPTYLTFRIEFILDSNDISNAKRNITYNNVGALDANGNISSDYGTFFYDTMFDYMPEPFLDDYKITSVDTSLGKRYSTESYLDMNLGDHGRAGILHNFKRALDDIQTNYPFYFKSISGLGSLIGVDPKRGMRLKDAKITIDCEEGIDLKITQLINMYKKIVWDDTYQRWVLPDMMRYFGMRIYISEIRTFQDVKIEGKKNINMPADYSLTSTKNLTATPSNETGWDQAMGIATQVAGLSNAFLGTKSMINQAVSYASQTMTAVDDVMNTVSAISEDIGRCNHAINAVLPTLCFECHMCEFDISDTMKHIEQLNSSNNESKAVSPKLTIKVGQVQESQAYPLNTTLVYGQINSTNSTGKPVSTYGYYNTIKNIDKGLNITDPGLNSFKSLHAKRDTTSLDYQGNYIYDEALNKKYKNQGLPERIVEYGENLSHIVGDSEANTIHERRLFNSQVINNLYDMTYDKDSMSQSDATMALVKAGLNEATDIANRFGGDNNVVNDIFGTTSLATHQDDVLVRNMQSIGDALQSAADEIYNNPALKSMAITDQQRANIANNLFDDYISELEESTATQNTLLKSILTQYRTLSTPQPDTLSTATSKSKIEGFSAIN